jgi:hypothetical protein
MVPAAQNVAESGRAREMLRSDSSSAIAVLVAARQILGDIDAWEPEAIWLSLEHAGIELPLANRAKLQAAIALTLVPSCYWDGIVFEKTAIAFAGRVPNPDALEEATSSELAAAVEEAGWILTLDDMPQPDFAHEPAAYAAVVLHREGLVLAPRQLAFCQELLDGMNRGSSELKSEVRAAWESRRKAELETLALAESAKDVQLAHLVAIELHVLEHQQRAAADLTLLSSSST